MSDYDPIAAAERLYPDPSKVIVMTEYQAEHCGCGNVAGHWVLAMLWVPLPPLPSDTPPASAAAAQHAAEIFAKDRAGRDG